MSDPLKYLKAEIHKHGFPNDLEGQHAKLILDLFDETLASSEGQLRHRAPPLDVLVYALKSILYPKFLSSLMSDFLHLFSMIEFYRIRATNKVENALAWNTYIKNDANVETVPLTEDDEMFFQHVVDSDEPMRKMFMQVVITCCFIELRSLWLRGSNTDFWLRWNEYLSVLRRPDDRRSNHTFHYKLSVDEISSLHDACVEFSSLMSLTGQWVEDNPPSGQPKSDIFESQPFREQFPDIEFTSGLEGLVDYHINFVQEVAQKLASNPAEDLSV